MEKEKQIFRDRRDPGRPKKIEDGKTISIWIDDELHARIVEYAIEHDMSVSEFVRSALEKKLSSV